MKILTWPVVAGAALGIVAPLLTYNGNPGNMGFCAACFLRDTAGALGLHRATPLQYLRPELIGLVLGALCTLRTLLLTRRRLPGQTIGEHR